MGTISEKLTYLNETKGKIKDSINLTGAGITDQDTFRSYETKLKDGFVDIINNGVDTLYENFPKVVQTGEEPTLNGVYEAPMRVDLNGNTEQDSYSGKNLCGIPDQSFTYNGVDITISNGEITMNGTGTGTGTKTITPIKTTTLNGDYNLNIIYVSGNRSGQGNMNIRNTDGTIIDGTQTTFNVNSNSNRTFNIPSSKSVIYGIYIYTGAIYENYKFKPQLVVGNTEDYNFEPFVGGSPSPSPDFPQPIEVVKGDNTIKVTGKNLLNVSNSYSVTTSQEVNINLETGTYSMSCTDITTDVTTGTSSLCNFYHSDNTFDQLYFSHTNKVGQITITAPVTKVKIYSSNSFNNSNGKTTTFTNLMIEKGSTNTSYQPYQKQTYPLNLGNIEVCKIGDYKDEIRKSTGKNLFDKNSQNLKQNYILNDNGEETQSNASQYSLNFTKVKPNTTYTIQGKLCSSLNVARIYEYDENKNWIKRSNGIGIDSFPYTFTTNNNTYYLRFQTEMSAYDGNTIQLEENNQATDYEPFGKVWYKKGYIGKIVLDGSESGWDNNFGINLFTINRYFNNKPFIVGYGLSNYYKYNSVQSGIDANTQNGDFVLQKYNDQYNLFIKNTNYNNVSDFKTWLSTHNTTVYYILATPTYEEITATTLIEQLEDLKTAKSVEGQTNITQTNEELPFILDVSGLKKD